MKQIDIAPYNKSSYNYKKINEKNAKKILDNFISIAKKIKKVIYSKLYPIFSTGKI